MILFTRTKKNITVGPEPGEKFVAQIKHGQPLTLDRLAIMVAEQSAMTAGDVYNVLMQANTIMGWTLQDGRPVDLGEFGKFYPKFKAKAMGEYHEVTADTISNITVRFMPGKRLKDIMKRAKVRFFEPITPTYAPRP